MANVVVNQDCLGFLWGTPDSEFDLVFADPPFNIGYKYDKYQDNLESTAYVEWSAKWIAESFRCLKPDGTFWLAIGDEYAAELKIVAKQQGFTCRSWIVLFSTFGVNCESGFTRSHTHLFHFVKNPNAFTFNKDDPRLRHPSARQLVYKDKRANPKGRLPDNTWILRPQDVPEVWTPEVDTWTFPRVCGTFKERQGWHPCQMPLAVLERVVLFSSNPGDLVFDPFVGSGTTLCAARKHGRKWLGTELSERYTTLATKRILAQDEISN